MAKGKKTDPLIFELMTATRKMTRSSLLLQSAIAEKMNLNPSDAECIDFLLEMGTCTAGDLARVTRLTTGAVTSVIDRLEKAGFVKREADPQDRRKVIIRFLPKKHERTKQYYTAMAADVFRVFSAYSASELQFLLQHTQQLSQVFQQHASGVLRPALPSPKKTIV